jgi:putative ABC transport system substrate-binding protein
MRVDLLSFPVRPPQEFTAAILAVRQQQAQALILLSSPSVFVQLPRIAELTAQHRLPAISLFPQFADLGGLMGFGPNLPDLYRRATEYVDRILKGTRAGDLPIQRPVLFRLAVNLKTARALGLTMPASILTRADSVIE